MTIRTILYSLGTMVFITILIVVSGQALKDKKNYKVKSKQDEFRFDTSKIAFVEFEKTWYNPFDNKCKKAKLTQKDLNRIDRLFNNCAKRNNINLKKNNYRSQIIAVTNSRGEKEVWINCFCETHGIDWKTKLILVSDGGDCYFNLKINLKKNICYNLIINGEA